MNNYNDNSGYNQAPQNWQNSQWPPMTLSNWLVSFLMMLIPIANIVFMFMWAFGSNVNPSKKTYFQAALIMMAAGFLLSILLGGALVALFSSIISSMG